MVCLDTDIIIHLLRDEPKTTNLIKQIQERGDKITTTSINGFELWKGAYRSKKKNIDKIVKEFLSEIKILNFDDVSSKKAAEIFESLKSKGEIIDVLDVIIASIAIKNKESLLTYNKKHFSRIKGLRLI